MALLLSCAAFASVAAPAFSADIYISKAGSDSAAGTQKEPFATLERARTAARSAGHDQTVTVWIEGGDYFLDKPFELSEADSGTAEHPVIYRAVPNQAVRLTGARRIAAADFKPVTNPATLERISPLVRSKIVELDLGTTRIQHSKASPDVFVGNGGLPDLFMGDRRMPLSRYPNTGYATIKTVIDNGISPQATGGIFQYRESEASRYAAWQKAMSTGHPVWLKGYWRIPWQNEAIRISSLDLAKQTVTFSKSIASGIGNKYHRPGGDGKEPYWALNLLEEIDQPGEWCIDFADQKLYFYPPAPLANSEILIADREGPVVEMTNVSHLAVIGITIDGNYGEGVSITGGESDLIAGCTIHNVDKYAIMVEGGKTHVVQSCDLYDLGCGGVWLGGGDDKSNPRIPAAHRVVNNHIHDFSQIEKIYTPGVNCGFSGGGGGGHHVAVGMYVAHNLIHDTPHGGVLFGSWDNLFEYNEVFRYCTVSNDLGAFYSYDLAGRFGNETFRYNLIHSSELGDGFYWDNDHPDTHVYGNIAYLRSGANKRGTGFLYKRGTQDKVPQKIDCHDNVAIQCNTGAVFVSVLPSVIENNVVVNCAKPWVWRNVSPEGKEIPSTEAAMVSGKNMVYTENPGFVDIEHFNFHLKPGSQLMKDLPQFKPIPVDKIGLYVDEYRKVLPTDEQIDRYSKRTRQAGLSTAIEDRK